MSGDSKHQLRTWLSECPIDYENPAVCEIIPCGHFISIQTARNYARLLRRGDRSANPHKCPLCRQPWTQIKCLSVEKTHEKIQSKLIENTQHIPDGPLRLWFQEILHFFTARNVIDDELKQLIGGCLVNTFIVRSESSSSKSGGTKSTGRRGDIINLTNNQSKIIELIKCIQKSVSDWIVSNFENREEAIKDNMSLAPDTFQGSPLEWLLTQSDELANQAIEQANTINLPERNEIVNTETVFSRIRRSLGIVATEAPRQIPAEMATVILSSAILVGAARMYKEVDYTVCEGLDNNPIPGPNIPTRGRWTGFPVCTSSFDQQYCCDPQGGSTGSGACGTDSYHTSDEPNVYTGPEIDYSQRNAMEPGGEYNCDNVGNGLLAGCIGNKVTQSAFCALVGDEDCDFPGGYAWATADGANFEVTETGPGPNLPSEHAQCSNNLSGQETMALGAAIVSVGVLLFGLYNACTNYQTPSQETRVNLVGDDSLVITSDGREHRGGYKKRRRKSKKMKKTKKKKVKKRKNKNKTNKKRKQKTRRKRKINKKRKTTHRR